MLDIFQERPQAGDLITADFINDILDILESLDQRVSTLEQASGTVTITGISGSLRIGGELRVMGSNFEVPARFNTVTLDTVEISSFNPGTDDANLVFNIPAVAGVPREVTLTVSNRNGGASWRFSLLPAQQVVTGELLITEVAEEHGVIEVGQMYTFRFQLASQTNMAEDYTLQAQYSGVTGATVADWEDATSLVNASDEQIESVRITPGSPVTVGVQVTVPAGAESVNLSLQVNSVNSPSDSLLNRTSNPVSIEVGEEVIVSDPRITFDALELFGAGTLITDDPELAEVIEVTPNGEAFIRVTAEFQVGGDFAYSTTVTPEATPWSAAVASPSPPATNEAAGGEQDIVISLQFNDNNPDPEPFRTLEIRVERTNVPPEEEFASWRRVAIRSSQ